jgi:hypothetical protein
MQLQFTLISEIGSAYRYRYLLSCAHITEPVIDRGFRAETKAGGFSPVSPV